MHISITGVIIYVGMLFGNIVGEDALSEKLKSLGEVQGGIPYSISFGYSFVDVSEKNAVGRAFSRADAMMYANKPQKKIPDLSL